MNSVRIYTDPPGPNFLVDGQSFLISATFLWPAGSAHTISSYDQPQAIPGTSLVYKGWMTNLSSVISKSGPITADPSLQWIKLVFDVSYLVTVDLVNCPDPTQPCFSPGTVQVNSVSYDRRTQFYLAAGTPVEARAFPNSGYVFTGWGPVPGQPALTVFDITFNLVGPTQLSPAFQPANAVQTQVSVVTDPPQLQVLLDRTPYVAPINLQWGWGTVHAVGADPVQVAHGVTYVFDSWSDGGAINHDYQVPQASTAINLTARFEAAALVGFSTSPPGLTLSIDGQTKFLNYNFAWAPGTTHQISAPATQTDAQGHKYRFVSWSNGQPAGFTYTAGPAPGGDRLTATYQSVGQATITSSPAGLSIAIDGAACTTPCNVEKDAGATATVSVPQVRNISDQSRLVFQGWGDSTGATRQITLVADPRTYTAAYSTQNRLLLAATPPDGASFAVSPSSSDGFYDSGTVVSVTANLALGFRVTMWTGDISGSATGAAVMLDAPKSAVLLLDPVPAIAPLGVRNAAAGASLDSVAAGSLISIFGASLSADLKVGPAGPLVQTLDNVTVRSDGTFLPLIFVSPGQINAQLPGALVEGAHTLTVRWEGKPETSTQVVVSRNAPGLFNTPFNDGSQDQPLGSFLRMDGSAVTPDQPVHANETIAILGTGLGPYAALPPDGFLFDENSGYTLVDPVNVVVGGQPGIAPIYAGRSSAGVGVDAVRFQVPAGLPAGALVPVKVQINGKESNTVVLPVSPQP